MVDRWMGTNQWRTHAGARSPYPHRTDPVKAASSRETVCREHTEAP